jgi:hypothetical protein
MKIKKEQLIKIGSLAGAVLLIVALGFFWWNLNRSQKADDAGKDIAENSSGAASVGTKTYTHPEYGFTFDYPADFTLGKFPEENGETILVQGADGKKGVQIFVAPYDEKGELSLDMIRKSAGDLVVKNEKESQIGRDKIKAFTFDLSSKSGDMETRAVWFVVDKNLYQIGSYQEFSNDLDKIMASWRFN